tara:strand:+ start:2489 stop:2632 length:144 start_codon:yes stop_codon:yes gene_type:complete
MDKQEALELLGEVVSSGAKTGFDEDAVNEAWDIIYQIVIEHADFDMP